MTDSKFCEHGVNVGLENPPVFCGQCPPATIATLRADLATETAAHEDRCREVAALRADLARVTEEAASADSAALSDRSRNALAWCRVLRALGIPIGRNESFGADAEDCATVIGALQANLAHAEKERDEAMAALEGVSNALGGLELYEPSETAGHVETAVADRDEALADLARVEAERDEARAKVAGLTLSPLAVKCIRRALDDASNDYANSYSDVDAEIVVEMDRYAEALGGGK